MGSSVDESPIASFPIGETAQERGFSHVPECYKVQPSHRALPNPKMADIPQIDFEHGISDPSRRSIIVDEIAAEAVLDGAMSAASDFFDLPGPNKTKYKSSDVGSPVRYCTSIKDDVDSVQFWRVFLKQYANPLHRWVGLWPDTPSDYRKKMGDFSVAVQKLAVDIMGLITESLGLGPSFLSGKLEEGAQVMVANCYPPCPDPGSTLGLPPHSDYACLTILHQDSFGLQILDPGDNTWKGVPVTRGALLVHVGDHLEVLSNGRYKGVVHKATLNADTRRISLASLHCLGMDEKMEAANELVDDDNPRGYRASSFRDFLDFVASNDIGDGKTTFLETLKIRCGSSETGRQRLTAPSTLIGDPD